MIEFKVGDKIILKDISPKHWGGLCRPGMIATVRGPVPMMDPETIAFALDEHPRKIYSCRKSSVEHDEDNSLVEINLNDKSITYL